MPHTPPDVVVTDDDAALARLVADRVVAAGREAIGRAGAFAIALAGGSTPKATYAVLASPSHRESLDWTRVRFYFGDERCVPPDHVDANYRMARETMLEPLAIEPSAVFRMHGEEPPADAARAYAARLVETLGERPAFDLVLLGMGPDGHTASLFPGTDPMHDAAALVRAPYVEKFATHRLTVTPDVINAARHVAIVVSGSAKAAMLHRIVDGTSSPIETPVRCVAPTTGDLTWLADRAAAAELTNVARTSDPR